MTKKQKQQISKISGKEKKPINRLFYLAGILILTVIVYSNSINNDFTYQFDDDLYITNNPDIKAFTAENLHNIFTKPYVGLYLPVTMLTYMIEWAIFGMKAAPYHTTNLLLHLINTVLIFLLIYKIKPNLYITSVVTFVFAIHPMHVESVSWISERKDVLYILFYLAGLITYLKFIGKRSAGNYLLTMAFFILSLLSKAVAVSFPLFLILFDWYYGRKLFSKAVILEKIPFFALSLGFGLLGIYFTSIANDTSTPDIAWIHRPFIVSGAVAMYLYKFIAPFNLAIYHYYPDTSSGILPAKFYVSAALLFILLVATLFWVIKSKKNKRDLLFGLAFFIIPTLFVLQLIPAGRAYAADRYTYLSYTGLAFIFAVFTKDFISSKAKNQTQLRAILIGIILFFALGFSYLTYQRNNDWKDSITLFTGLIEENPDHGHPYLIRAITYVQFGKNELALADYNKSIELDPTSIKALANRSSARGMLGDYDGALEDATRALAIKPNDKNALNNRATALFFKNDFKGALADYNSMLAMDSLNTDLIRKKIMALEKIGDKAGVLDAYLTLTRLEPRNDMNFAKVGEIYYQANENQKAIEYLSRALLIKPSFYQLLFIRGNAYFRLNKFDLALSDYMLHAEKTGDANSFYNQGQCYLQLNKMDEACEAWQQAYKLNHSDALKKLNQYCR